MEGSATATGGQAVAAMVDPEVAIELPRLNYLMPGTATALKGLGYEPGGAPEDAILPPTEGRVPPTEGRVPREDCSTFSKGAIQGLFNAGRVYAAGARSSSVRSEWRQHGVTRPTVVGRVDGDDQDDAPITQ